MDAFSVVVPFVLSLGGVLFYAPRAKLARARAIEALALDFESAAVGLYDSFGRDDWDGETIHRARLTILQLDLRRKEKTDPAFAEAVYGLIARRGVLTQGHFTTLQPFLLARGAPSAVPAALSGALQPAAA